MTVRRSSRHGDGDSGETLVELLITIAIIGSAVIALLAGIAVALDSSDEHKKQVGVVVVLNDYAEAVMNAPYVPCAAPAVSYTPPAGYVVEVTAVASYDGTSWSPAAFGGCPAQDTGAVRISLEARSTDDRARRTLEIVKVADYARPS